MKPRLLFISHVNPVDPRSGQQQRVLYSIKAAQNFFHTTFLTLSGDHKDVEPLKKLCDEVISLPPISSDYRTKLSSFPEYLVFTFRTGLKRSNFVIGEIEFSPDRLENILKARTFDYVIFEYWHAYKSASLFHRRRIPCILDMHDVLWKAFEQQVKTRPIPFIYKERIKKLYQKNEETAWRSFDRIMALNKEEQSTVKAAVSRDTAVDLLPMGIDLSAWQYLWEYKEGVPARIGFYGGLSSKVNVNSALHCLDEIMPIIWRRKPEAEFWLIGNNPAKVLLQRAKTNSRIHVTGYVEKVQQVIAEMGVILCPWEGVFGFRTRVIEVMAVGTPLVVSQDAIAGMGIADDAIRIGQNDTELANAALEILENRIAAQQISRIARKDVEQNFSYECTYLSYFRNLATESRNKCNA